MPSYPKLINCRSLAQTFLSLKAGTKERTGEIREDKRRRLFQNTILHGSFSFVVKQDGQEGEGKKEYFNGSKAMIPPPPQQPHSSSGSSASDFNLQRFLIFQTINHSRERGGKCRWREERHDNLVFINREERGVGCLSLTETLIFRAGAEQEKGLQQWVR